MQCYLFNKQQSDHDFKLSWQLSGHLFDILYVICDSSSYLVSDGSITQKERTICTNKFVEETENNWNYTKLMFNLSKPVYMFTLGA
jgi:hypothetical protein